VKKKRIYVLLAGMVLLLLCSSCGQKKTSYYEKSNIVMDTVVTLSASGDQAEAAVEAGFKRLDELNEMASATIPTSDISRINAAAGKNAVKVQPEIFKMLEVSQKYSQLSDGAWDITLGPIINLWGIGTEQQRVPAAAEIQAALPLVGYEKISLNEADQSVKLEKEGMALDLGGIAKGYAVDEVRRIYQNYHIESGLINLGASSLYAVGKNKDHKDWAVGIKHPRLDDPKEYLGIIKLKEENLSTSGDYERCFIEGDKRYHHIIDPKTGYPADNGVMSDTVVLAADVEDGGMLSDLLTTTIFIMGAEKGVALVNSLGIAQAEITTADYKVHTSNGFAARIINLSKDFSFAD